MYELQGRQIVSHIDGGIDHVVAEVREGGDLEAAGLLVARANLADRDEALLDRLGELASSRNLTE